MHGQVAWASVLWTLNVERANARSQFSRVDFYVKRESMQRKID